MSDYWTAPCACPMCVLANTELVQFAPKYRQPGRQLHGRPAQQFLASRQRGMTAISELGAQLRKDLGIK